MANPVNQEMAGMDLASERAGWTQERAGVRQERANLHVRPIMTNGSEDG